MPRGIYSNDEEEESDVELSMSSDDGGDVSYSDEEEEKRPRKRHKKPGKRKNKRRKRGSDDEGEDEGGDEDEDEGAPTTIADLPEARICKLRIEISLLFGENRLLAFNQPLKKSNRGIAFIDAPKIILPGITDALKAAFYPEYNYHSVVKAQDEAVRYMKKTGVFRQLHTPLRLVEKSRLGFLPSKKNAAKGFTGGRMVDNQVNAMINGRAIIGGRSMIAPSMEPTEEEYKMFMAEPWSRTRSEIQLLLPETRAHLTYMFKEQKCRPIVAQLLVWDRDMARATRLEQVWLKTDTFEFVLVEMKIGQDFTYEWGTDVMRPPFQAYSNCPKNQHMLQLFVEKRMAEFTYKWIMDQAWVIRIANDCTISKYELEPWVGQQTIKMVRRLKSQIA